MADGRHHLAFGVARQLFGQQDHLGAAGECVAPQHHRHRAGMAGFAQQLDIQISLPGNRRHDAKRLVAMIPAPGPARYALRHKPRRRPARKPPPEYRRPCCRIAVIASRSVTPSRSIACNRSTSNLPAHGERRRQRHRKAHALLVAEGQHVDPKRQFAFGAREMFGRENAGNDAERTVEHPRLDHGVDMRAYQKPFAVAAGPVAPDRAERVFRNFKPGFAHPFSRQIGGGAMLRRQERADQPVRFGRDRGQRPDHGIGAFAQVFGIELCGVVVSHEVPERFRACLRN